MKKILIIEDDPFLSEMYLSKFNQSGFDAEAAFNGAEGLEKIKKFKPDLILLDVVLPEMDGFEVLKQIKEDTTIKNIAVILLTNLGQKADVEKGLALGADGYIIKAHFTPTAVVAKAKEILEGGKDKKNGKRTIQKTA